MSKVEITEIGIEKLCPKCNEYWPADKEFYHSSKITKDGLYPWCKACHADWHRNKYPTKHRIIIDPARNEEVVECRDNGLTFTEIGERFNITRQRAQQICKRQRAKKCITERINR
jgi:transposase-like protein